MTDQNQRERSRGEAVLVQLGCGTPNVAALEAAILLAKTLSSGVEGLFIEDERLVDAATYSFTREVSVFSGRARAISTETVRTEMLGCARAVHQRLQAIAQLHDVALNYHIERQRPHEHSCAAGPDTRFVALSQPQLNAGGTSLFQAIEDMPRVEGFLVAGADARKRAGPLLMVVHPQASLDSLAERVLPLARKTGRELLILPSQADHPLLAALHRQFGATNEPGVRLLRPLADGPTAMEAIVRRFDIGLAAMELTHPLARAREDLRHLAATLTTPLLLLRPKGQ